MKPPHHHGGHTTRETTCWCCSCDEWLQMPAPATRTFERKGWRKTRHGWCCPDCLAAPATEPPMTDAELARREAASIGEAALAEMRAEEDVFDLNEGASPEEMERRTAKANEVMRALDTGWRFAPPK